MRLREFGARHGFQVVARVKVAAQDALDLADVALGHLVHRRKHGQHRVVRQAVEHELGLPPCCDQPRTPQVLQMLRGVGDREPGAFGQRLHAALALSDELEQLEAVLVGDRLRHGGELDVEVALGVAT